MLSQVNQAGEHIEAPRNAPSGLVLRDYQEAAVAAALAPKPDVWRRLLVLATGGGKTLVAAEIINRTLQPGQKALFLAHRDELFTQAKTEIEGFVPDIRNLTGRGGDEVLGSRASRRSVHC
jgi:superfamily II DNA or RNA helicase